MGYALSESTIWDENGRLITSSFLDYKFFRSPDMPEVQVEWVESNDALGPFGAKGAGEPGMVATAAAMANALYDAVGIKIKELPITPERVINALHTHSIPHHTH